MESLSQGPVAQKQRGQQKGKKMLSSQVQGCFREIIRPQTTEDGRKKGLEELEKKQPKYEEMCKDDKCHI